MRKIDNEKLKIPVTAPEAGLQYQHVSKKTGFAEADNRKRTGTARSARNANDMANYGVIHK